jgi:hypothetical protein
MAKKTWFQHDFNCAEKEKFSALIAKGGFEAYGRFWAFAELWYSMQAHKSGEYLKTQRIHERTLIKSLQMNCRSLPKLMHMFSETLGIVWRKFGETYGIVYETTWDNSLNYINERFQKKIHIELEEEEKKNKNIYSSVFLKFWTAYPKKHGKGAAYKEWLKENPPIDLCIATLEWQKKTNDWIKEKGQFIPDPERWIKKRRWLDEISLPIKPEEIKHKGNPFLEDMLNK